MFEVARRAYPRVRADERQARAAGASSAEAAALGSRELEQALGSLGFHGYDSFMDEALPAEISARVGMVTAWSAQAAQAAGGVPAAAILAAAADLDRLLSALVARLDVYRDLSQALSEFSRSTLAVATQLEAAFVAGRDGSAHIADRVPVLHNVTQVMAGPCRETVSTMRSGVNQIDTLREQIVALRFRIALAQLHNDMIAAFAAQIAVGTAPSNSLREVPLLCDALHDGVLEMTAALDGVNSTLTTVTATVSRAGELFTGIRSFAGEWRRLVFRHRAEAALAPYTDAIDRMLSDSFTQLTELSALAARCRAEVFPIDADAFAARLTAIRSAAG